MLVELDDEGWIWTRDIKHAPNARTAIKSIINVHITHFWHFVFCGDGSHFCDDILLLCGGCWLFSNERWLSSNDDGRGAGGSGWNIARVSNVDGSGWDECEITTAECGLLLFLCPDFLCISAACELVDIPDEAVDTEEVADEL